MYFGFSPRPLQANAGSTALVPEAEPIGMGWLLQVRDAGCRTSSNATTALTALVEPPPTQHRKPPPPGAACVVVRLTCSSQAVDTSPQRCESRRATSRSVRKPRLSF